MFRNLEEQLAHVVKELINKNNGNVYCVHLCENCTLNPYRVMCAPFDFVDKDKFYENYGKKTFFTETKAQAVANELNAEWTKNNQVYNPNIAPLNEHRNNSENARDVVWNDGWILITEKLPEMCKTVLVTVANANGTRSVDWDYYIDKNKGWHRYSNKVIAWTPYPNAYNGSVR